MHITACSTSCSIVSRNNKFIPVRQQNLLFKEETTLRSVLMHDSICFLDRDSHSELLCWQSSRFSSWNRSSRSHEPMSMSCKSFGNIWIQKSAKSGLLSGGEHMEYSAGSGILSSLFFLTIHHEGELLWLERKKLFADERKNSLVKKTLRYSKLIERKIDPNRKAHSILTVREKRDDEAATTRFHKLLK